MTLSTTSLTLATLCNAALPTYAQLSLSLSFFLSLAPTINVFPAHD